MNKVLWIDDSPNDLAYIVAPVVKKMWEKEIKSDMYIVGDFEKENSNMNDSMFNQSIKQLNELVASEFINFLIEENIINDDKKSHEKYKLINNKFINNSDELLMPTSDIASINIKGVSIFDNIMESWKKIDEKIFITTNDSGEEQEDYSKISEYLKDNKLIGDTINNIMANIKEESYDAIFIDMCLLKYDYKKLRDKNNIKYKYKFMIPIFSMALYNAAQNSGLKAYMYTSYTVIDNYVAYWNETYKSIFSQETIPEEIDFYNRKGKNIVTGEFLYKKVIEDLGL